MKDDPLYLTKNRFGVYTYRRPILEADQSFWLGPTGRPKKEWNKSLGTKDRREAISRMQDAAEAFDAERARQIDAAELAHSELDTRASEEAEALARVEAAREARQSDPRRREARLLWRERLQLTTAQLDPADAAIVDLIQEGQGDNAELAEANSILRAEIAALRNERSQTPIDNTHTIDELVEAYTADKKPRWSNSTRKAVQPVFRLLRDVFSERRVASVKRSEAREVMELLKRLPTQIGRRPKLAGLSVREAIVKGEALRLPTIKPKTINDGYLIHLSAVFAWAVKEQWTTSNPFSGLSVNDPVSDDDRRDPFTEEQLLQIFSGGIWSDPWEHSDAGAGDYWVPLLCLFQGLRNGEASGLRAEDVYEIDGIPVLDLREYEGRSLKTAGSKAVLPIHPKLRAVGFLSFVETCRERGAILFPDGKPNNRGQWGAKLGERFSRRVKALGLEGRRLGMHSFRHNFEDALRAAELPSRTALALARRAEPGSGKFYGNGLAIRIKDDALAKVNYRGLDLSHLDPRR